MIEFHLDGRSGVAPYMQLIQQVRRALRLGLLTEGDQLRARGVGTFVTRTLDDASVAAHGRLRKELRAWLDKARAAGLDDPSIEALFVTTFSKPTEESP